MLNIDHPHPNIGCGCQCLALYLNLKGELKMNKYLVVTVSDGEVCTSLKTSRWILDYMDMSDCFEYDDIQVYDIQYPNPPVPLTLHYAWHDPKHPLFMCATNPENAIVFSGFGTDH